MPAILCHHPKITKKQLAEDPFMALSGAGNLRSFYTSGVIMHRPDEERPGGHFELRNGPGIEPMIIGKADGRWIVIVARGKARASRVRRARRRARIKRRDPSTALR